jgi:pre-mRNA-splicing factor CWC26
MQAYLAAKYMSGPKADAILSKAAPEKKKKKRRHAAESSAAAAPSMIVDEDGGWDGRLNTNDNDDGDEFTEAVVASDRSFKKRRTVAVKDGTADAEGSGWTTVREGERTGNTPPPPDEQPQVVEPGTFTGGLLKASEMKKHIKNQKDVERKQRGTETAEEQEEARLAQETVYRDATGRKIDTKAEKAEAARRKREMEEREAQKMEWGKGLVQREDKAARAAQLERERNRGLAVYADDKELNDELKSKDRWNDPAAQFLTVSLL